MNLHARFSTHPEPFPRWLLDRCELPAGARVLDLGCGPASLWEANLDRIDPSWRLTLADQSAGMIETARAVLGERAGYAVADAHDLPFADASFDAVLANHMLYHVEDRPKGLAEIARVLAPGGMLHAATNGFGHMAELRELVGADWGFNGHIEAFGLESGRSQLEAFFVDVRCERYDNALEATDVDALVGYVESSLRWRGDREALRARLAETVEREGAFRVRTDAGVFHARRP